jgi:hypothetical protein
MPATDTDSAVGVDWTGTVSASDSLTLEYFANISGSTATFRATGSMKMTVGSV